MFKHLSSLLSLMVNLIVVPLFKKEEMSPNRRPYLSDQNRHSVDFMNFSKNHYF